MAEIKRMILNHEIAPGAPIRQEEIASHLGVSRIPVREALMMLEARGQVDYAPHFGFSVPKLTADELVEIYLIREKLEELALSKTVERATAEDVSRLHKALVASDKTLNSGNLLAMTRANQDFHFAMFEPSGMKRLIKTLEDLWDAMAAYRPTSFMDPQERQQISRDHHEIFEAIRDRDYDRALSSLVNHRSSIVASLRRAVAAPE